MEMEKTGSAVSSPKLCRDIVVMLGMAGSSESLPAISSPIHGDIHNRTRQTVGTASSSLGLQFQLSRPLHEACGPFFLGFWSAQAH